MSNVSFPLTMREISAMFRDNDKISIFFLTTCLVSLLLVVWFWRFYNSSRFLFFFLFISLVSFFVMYIYRAYFVSRKLSEMERLFEKIYDWLDNRTHNNDGTLKPGSCPISFIDIRLHYQNEKVLDLKKIWDELKDIGKIYYSDLEGYLIQKE